MRHSTPDRRDRHRGMTALGSLTRREQVEHVVQAAGLAPSIHNTQPWRFSVEGGWLVLDADRSRGLTVTDPSGRQLLLSCGSALLHARAAARGLGLSARVRLLPDPDRPDRLALLDLTPALSPTQGEVLLATAILHRHTFRGAFPVGGLPTGLLDLMRLEAEGEGVVLSEVSSRDDLVALEVLLSRADLEQERDPAHVAELASWVHPDGAVDGLSPAAVRQVAPGSSLRQRDFGASRPAGSDGSTPEVDHPVVLVLSTLEDGPQQWLEAGQALAAVLLLAAEHGVQGQPLGQVTDSEGYRERLRSVLGLVGTPQLVLRMGVAHEHLVSTPRRSTQDVMGGASRVDVAP